MKTSKLNLDDLIPITPSFDEMAATGKPFYQVFFRNRTNKKNSGRSQIYFETREEVDNVIQKMKDYNKQAFERMLELYKDYGITENNYLDNHLWNGLTDEYSNLSNEAKELFRYEEGIAGFDNISFYYRDLEEEEREMMAAEEEAYEEQGPYGGAFADDEDYWRWKEGPGFFK